MSALYNFNSAYSLVQTLYGIDPDPEEFEDIGMTAWELIGNKHTVLYRFVGNTDHRELLLPCNVVDIESVHIPIADAQVTSNQAVFADLDNILTEHYIDAWRFLDDPFNQRGKLVKYKEGGDKLYFNRDYPNVMVVYHGILVDDEDGLPLINVREQKAIAAFVAYTETYKDAIRRKDKNFMAIAQDLKVEWLRRCNAARSVDHLSQNDMNMILDVKTRWDHKHFGKSHLPII